MSVMTMLERFGIGWRGGLAAAIVALFAGIPAVAQEREVDVELVLAVDVSRSMTPEELEIQRRGYAAALSDPQVIDAMLSGLTGRVVITFLEWAGDGNQSLIVPWREIASAQDAQAFAELLMQRPLASMRYTSISGAILSGMKLFDNNGFAGLRRVIDISGDGPNNQGVPVTEARDLAIENGIIINGLPLMTSSAGYSRYTIPDLDVYYIECVIGGPASFSLPVFSWEAFPEAVRRKLVLELAARPQPDWPQHAVTDALLRPVSESEDYDCLIGEKLRRQWEEP